MFEYLNPIKLFIEILENLYDRIKKMRISYKKRELGRELIQILLKLQNIIFLADEIFKYISNSEREIKKVGPDNYIRNLKEKFQEQAQKIYSLVSSIEQGEFSTLYSIFVPDMKINLRNLCLEKGGALIAVIHHLHDIRIKFKDDTLFVNQKVNFSEIEHIKKWYRKIKVEDIRLLDRIHEQRQIINEIKDKTENLRIFLKDTFNIEELISYTI